MTKKELAGIFRRAANLIEARGWYRGGFEGDDGSLCILGACSVARTGNAFSPGYEVRKNLAARLHRRASDWNDKVVRRKETVVSKLRTFARDLEHGGKLYA